MIEVFLETTRKEKSPSTATAEPFTPSFFQWNSGGRRWRSMQNQFRCQQRVVRGGIKVGDSTSAHQNRQ